MQTAPGRRDEVQRILRGPALVQEWASAADLERYLRSEDRRKLVAVLELASRPPEIWVDTIVMREGLEPLAMLMGSSAGGERHE
jgi:hypothetical protein